MSFEDSLGYIETLSQKTKQKNYNVWISVVNRFFWGDDRALLYIPIWSQTQNPSAFIPSAGITGVHHHAWLSAFFYSTGV
jgi:hypothetical protein